MIKEFKNNSKYKIAVSILNCDFMNLKKEIKKVEQAGIKMLHIDVMDGNFVPNITIGQPIVKKIRENTKLFLDVHLMIKNPDRHIDSFIESGADLINVHVEECAHLDKTLSYIKQAGIKAAAALNPATPLCFVENVFQYLDMILIMTVNPGFGGQKFINKMVYKIKKLKDMIENYENYSGKVKNIDIQVDGGINPMTAQSVINAGANVLVVGTAFFNSSNPREFISQIKQKFISKSF
jgi:ribulose-phosphate 3-epimerase